MRLALWTPTPGAAWVSAVVPLLGSGARVVDAEVQPASVPADAHVFHVAAGPEHGFVCRALRVRRGVLLLEEWDLSALVLAETAGRGDPAALRQAARRAAGDTGALVARQLERNLAGEMLTLEAPLVEVVLDECLAVAAMTREVFARVQAARPDLPLAHLPLPFVAAGDGGGRAAARRALGLGPARALVVVLPPSGTRARERVLAAIEPLRHVPALEVRVAPAGAPAAELVEAADVLVALEHPSRGGLDPRVGRAVAQGVATLVTAGSTASIEMPEGVVVRVSPGESEADELRAQVGRLLADEPLRARVGALARAWARDLGDPRRQAGALLELVGRALEREAALPPARDHGPAGRAVDELRWVARSAGLPDAPGGATALARGLFASGSETDAAQGEASGDST